MPITLKKDEWKVKDPSSGNYRGAAILSTTLPEDAAQIIEDTQNALDAEEVRAGQIINNTQNTVDGIEAQSSLILENISKAIHNGTDKTLTVEGMPADAKATGDLKMSLPAANDYGENGQYPRSTGSGIEWTNYGLPSDQQTAEAVEAWLDAHPEATTSVEDASLTEEKFTNDLKLKTLKDYVTPEMFGAICDGITDDTNSLQQAINYGKTNKKNIYIGFNDKINITTPVMLTGNVTLIIDGQIISKTSTAIHINGSNNSINSNGNGKIIGNKLDCGILIGGENKTVSSNYNRIENINIDGFEEGIRIYNNQLNSLTTYFNIITNLFINNCNIGIGLYGNANAEQISKIVFTNCGTNNTNYGAIVCRNINSQFPLDNSITQIFHHASQNAYTLNIEKINYSLFYGIISEQGGTTAKSIVITDSSSTGNQFFVISNVAGFRSLPSNFFTKNIVTDIGGRIAGNEFAIREILDLKGKFTKVEATESTAFSTKRIYKKTGISENTTVVLGTLGKNASTHPRVFKLRVLSGTQTYVSSLKKYGEATIFVSGYSTDNITIIDQCGSTIAVNDSNQVTFFVGNNGTSTTKGVVIFEIEEIFDNSNISPTFQYFTLGDGFVAI